MNYSKIYDSIIQKAKESNRKKGLGIYYELHHIIPLCMNGENKMKNMVLLTAREHFVCHKLLFKIHPHNKKLALAYHNLTYCMQDKRKLKLSSREYEEARMAAVFASSGENNPRYGVKVSDETKRKSSEAQRAQKRIGWNKGLTKETNEILRKVSEKLKITNKGLGLGKPKSKQMKERLAHTRLIRPRIYKKGYKSMKTRKPFSAINQEGKSAIFSGGVEMEELFGIATCDINACLKKRQNTTKGWTNFKYI